MNDRPFALLITWTTYGTWLPGDERGYVSSTQVPHAAALPKQNQYGTPYTRDDGYTKQVAYAEQKHPTVWLTLDQAKVVAETLIKACQEKGWHIAQAAIMSNHVHVLVMQCPQDGPGVRRILKGTTQAALSRHAGQPKRWFTTRGSDRYKFDQQAVDNAYHYVKRQEGMLVGIENMKVYIPSEVC